MTKTLTEQWREGEIKEGFYYVHFHTREIVYRYLSRNKPDVDFVKCFKEVLAPVPSYDEYKKLKNQIADLSKKVERLQEQLDIVTEQRNDIHIDRQVLQEQLADASKTIDYYDKKDFHYTLADGTVMGKEPAHQYKLKWGVK